MRNKISLFILAVAILNLAVTWPWDAKVEKKTEQTQTNRETKEAVATFSLPRTLEKAAKDKSAMDTPKEASSQRLDGTSPQSEKEKKRARFDRARRQQEMSKDQELLNHLRDMEAQQRLRKLTSQPRLPTLVSESALQIPKKSIQLQKASPSTQDMRIVQIQQQVQEMVRVNDSLQASSTRQAAEIRRLGEQVKSQQTILRNAQQVPNAANNIKVDDTQEILRQQKIRTLNEQIQQVQRIRVVEEVKRNT